MAVDGGSFLLEKGADPYTPVGGFRSQSFNVNDEEIDITNVSHTDRWQRLADGLGAQSVVFSGSGILDSTAAQKALVADKLASSVDAYRVTVPGIGTFAGDFKISQLEFSGDKNAEGQVNLGLNSAGQITFTAEA